MSDPEHELLSIIMFVFIVGTVVLIVLGFWM